MMIMMTIVSVGGNEGLGIAVRVVAEEVEVEIEGPLGATVSRPQEGMSRHSRMPTETETGIETAGTWTVRERYRRTVGVGKTAMKK
jgi:hypothetical protein